MNKRTYPYDSPYDFRYTVHPEPANYNREITYQAHNPTMPQYQQPVQQQTPFEYFEKPNQPENWPDFTTQTSDYYQDQQYQQQYQQQDQQYEHQYQQQYEQPYQQQQANPAPSFLNQFQTENGQVDIQKMLSTVGQLANTVQQVSPVIKEVGSIIKIFR